ncbi:hypothetical protein [uncultured Megasphaera sp.]|uniref:hypothetical protein n=1 Tax=uncultured Megasphaera sp. TaxID=165188 RepID=UPI0025D3453A|nr:hypothetical protein [uncultured Megasphaera sp.]
MGNKKGCLIKRRAFFVIRLPTIFTVEQGRDNPDSEGSGEKLSQVPKCESSPEKICPSLDTLAYGQEILEKIVSGK